jgi:uncharacterized membrane protein YphA (DoxX/SURF4 family)
MKQTTIIEIITLLFVLLFLYTGTSKLTDYTLFKEQIGQSPILTPIAPGLAWALPFAEYLTAGLLLIPRWRRMGLYAALGLMLLFSGYIIAILSFSQHVPCSCGGVLASLSWKGHLLFNGAFTGLAMAGVLLERGVTVHQLSKTAALPQNQQG